MIWDVPPSVKVTSEDLRGYSLEMHALFLVIPGVMCPGEHVVRCPKKSCEPLHYEHLLSQSRVNFMFHLTRCQGSHKAT